MAILIDGYNLLHAAGIFPPDGAPGTLQRAREALVDYLCRRLPADEAARTTIVFDARHAPPGLPRERQRGGITLLFAPRDRSADELLGELIRQDSAPRRLTVVSSDHQVQRSAKRRGARAVDSDRWCDELVRFDSGMAEHAGRPPSDEPDEPAKPEQPLSDPELAYWLEQFQAAPPPPPPAPRRTPSTPPRNAPPRRPPPGGDPRKRP